MQLFVLKALREGQPKHSKKGRKKFIGSNKKNLKWSDSGKGMWKYFRKSSGTLFHEIVPKLGCSDVFPALGAGREVRYAYFEE